MRLPSDEWVLGGRDRVPAQLIVINLAVVVEEVR